MEIVQLQGSGAQMGEAFGEQCREAITELYALRVANALHHAHRYGSRAADEGDLLALAAACWRAQERFDPDGASELAGIARGALRTPEEILTLGGLTDLRDALAWGGPLESDGGCTAVLVQRDRASGGESRLAQNWDLATDNGPFVVGVHRIPENAPETWCVTTVGALSLVGMNDRGLAVGTTNVRTLDARPGVPYLGLIHRMLRCEDAEQAAGCLVSAPRAAAHTYLLADARGTTMIVACTALQSAMQPLSAGTAVQTNHCRVPAHQAIEADTPHASSHARYARMTALLGDAGPIGDAELRRFLSDKEGAELAICRDDFDGISTNASIVMSPSAGRITACAGRPDVAPWIDLREACA